ncbi:MAG TPA: hypothetical protein VFL70_09655 [Bacteroidia bacterium]|nr:hypothetical protein [Bacteroidia bacterium]
MLIFGDYICALKLDLGKRMNAFYKYGSFAILICYAFVAFLILPFYRYVAQIDTFQYLVIATKYANGFFMEAVNSYWSPLLSWLLIPFIQFHCDTLFTLHVLQIIISIIALCGIYTLIPLQKEKSVSVFIVLLSITISILPFAFLAQTPDLLFATVVIWYLVLLLKSDWYFKKKYSFLLLGLIGGLMYFAKYPGFFAFIFSFSIFNLYHFLKKTSSTKNILTKYILSIALFLLISSCWIVMISKKEQRFLVSSTMEYNFNIAGPKLNPNVLAPICHPIDWRGLLPPPPNKFSLSAWEEPNKTKPEAWNPLDNEKTFIHYIKIILRNVVSIQSFYFGKDYGTILLIGLCFLFYIDKKYLIDFFKNNLLLILIASSFTLPYLLVFVMERYIWINKVVLSMLAISLVKFIPSEKNTAKNIFILVFCCMQVYLPIYDLLHPDDDNKEIFQEKYELSTYIHGNTASLCNIDESKEKNHMQSSAVSYLIKCPYYGMLAMPMEEKALFKQLKQHKISYVLVWSSDHHIPEYMYSEKKDFKCGLTAYKLR